VHRDREKRENPLAEKALREEKFKLGIIPDTHKYKISKKSLIAGYRERGSGESLFF
jgi:hypothetical protein